MPAAQSHVALPPRYRVVRHIANGGMASVWAAEDSVLERLVAVKTLAAGFSADPSARHRFTREARAAARVSDHQHVVTVFDTGEHEGQAFIVMEHLAGGTIADRLRSGEPVPVPTALDWLEQAASALDAAHAADIVHRDVKPGNLLLDGNGRLAVGDFGIASIAGETAVTQAGQVLGTAAYLSPEQAQGQPATPASDRYSLAVVAYELLCGKRPFNGDTPIAQARAHAEVDPPTPTGPCEAAAAALKHGLAKDPAARPPSAMAFVEELRTALGTLAEPARVTPLGAGEARFTRAQTPAPPPVAPVEARDAGAAAGAGAAGAGAAVAAAESARADEPGLHTRELRHARRSAPLAVVVAVLLAGGAAVALLAGSSGGSRSASSKAATHRSSTTAKHRARHSHKAATTAVKQPAAVPAPTASTPAPATSTPAAAAADGRTPAQLNDAGYAMLPGNPAGAVPLLKRSVDGFRQAGQRSDPTYAYALYNLGWALRLSGHPADAIPYLQERLQISNYKRGIVEQELQTAEQQAGMSKGKGKGKKAK